MKYVYILLFLSVGTTIFISADTNFRELLKEYSQNKRELSQLSNETELEKRREEIRKKLSDIAARLGTTREELDSVPNYTTEPVSQE